MSLGRNVTAPEATAFGLENEEMITNHSGYSTAITTRASSSQMMTSITQSLAFFL